MSARRPELDSIFTVGDIEQISNWRRNEPPSLKSDDRDWDHPIVMKVKGKPGLREYFTIGALATALGRKTVTIRSWEDKRLFPRAEYLLPPKGVANLPDKNHKGKRMYTRAQIEVAVAAARATGVYDPRNYRLANWPEFTRLVFTGWAELRKRVHLDNGVQQ